MKEKRLFIFVCFFFVFVVFIVLWGLFIMFLIVCLRHRAPGDAEQLFALFRAMVAAIVFYDYVSVNIGGVFVKRSEIDILACINVLKEHGGDASDLLNTVRYGTHSFQRGDTPKRVLDAML
jgi:hypothetical protein